MVTNKTLGFIMLLLCLIIAAIGIAMILVNTHTVTGAHIGVKRGYAYLFTSALLAIGALWVIRRKRQR